MNCFDEAPHQEVIMPAADFAQMCEEIKQLHAECDRLTAMLGSQKILSAAEVTEPGWYWSSLGGNDKAWIIVRVVRYGILDELHVMNSFGGYYPLKHLHGQQFIGPLTPPEV